MARFTRSLWPERVRRPWLRLAVAMIAAPLAMAAALTGLAFLAAGLSERAESAAMAVTREAAVVFFVGLPAFALTLGLAAVAVLWATARRGAVAWAVAGAIAGLAGSAGQVLIVGSVTPGQIAVSGALGLLMFLLIRWFGGVKDG